DDRDRLLHPVVDDRECLRIGAGIRRRSVEGVVAMPRLCANIGFLFPEMPFLDRFEAAARAGFTAVEFASPYEYPADDLRALLQANGLSLLLINSPPGTAPSASAASPV